jgi:predicted tellurium resistance membrane protein TerC
MFMYMMVCMHPCMFMYDILVYLWTKVSYCVVRCEIFVYMFGMTLIMNAVEKMFRKVQ